MRPAKLLAVDVLPVVVDVVTWAEVDVDVLGVEVATGVVVVEPGKHW